ncbi:MAG: long-chain-acyl-CoA synthetase, partial [Hyphomicrobiales bacterium]|nr:long-chain-acyl-CoA synthetase [Hyphomicrobiales bacterium]
MSAGMLARLKSEIAYARGILRALTRSTTIGKSPQRTIGDYFDDWARAHADKPALIGQSESFTYR